MQSVVKHPPHQNKQMVILNLSNLTGILNHAIEVGPGQYKPLRIDYRALLDFVTEGVAPMRAVAISQRDVNINRDMTSHDKFLRGLSNFGWTTITTLFDSVSRDTNAIETAVLHAVYDGFTKVEESTGNLILNDDFDPRRVDLVFVSGSILWDPIIQRLHEEGGFNCKVAFPNNGLNPAYNRWPFLDLEPFLEQQQARMIMREEDRKRKATY